MNFQVWAEVYRPKTLKDVINQKHVIDRLKAFVRDKSIPHCLFAGSAGVGKTSAALAMAQDLYGNTWRQNVLEMNASDTRGIDVIRGEVKEFARIRAIGNVPYKLIIMDESDNLTRDAQQALRRTLENFTRTTRFILICVSPNTKIVLPGEKEITIEDFQNLNKFGVLSVNAHTLSLEKDEAVSFISLDTEMFGKKCLKLITETGRKLELTEDHPLLTKNGWRRAGKIEEGEFVAVFPNLEGIGLEKKNETIVDEEEFGELLQQYELNRGKKTLEDARKFEELMTHDKEVIKEMILWLYNSIILTNKGLTARENEVYQVILNSPLITRFEVQKIIGLSRIRIVQLLKSLEKKSYVKRIIDEENSKIHRFLPLRKGSIVLRNKMDIKHFIERKFKIFISYTTVKNMIEKKEIKGISPRIIRDLKIKGLLPLVYSNPKIGIIARIVGFLFGDGHLALQEGLINFTGNRTVLKRVREDLISLGFRPQKIRSNFIKTKNFKGRVVSGITTFFNLSSVSLWNLFLYLKVPKGDKCKQSYGIPDWIKKGTKFVKREFLRGFFDSEMVTPTIKKNNFEALWFVQHKIENALRGGIEFVNQIKHILEEFDVKTSKIKVEDTGYVRKTGEVMKCIRFVLKASNKNLFNFFRRIGFCYDNQKARMSRFGNEYLRYKLHIIGRRGKIATKVLIAIKGGKAPSEIIREFDCSYDFVSDRIEGKEVRVSYKDLESFDEWIKNREIKNSEIIWNKVESIEPIKLKRVMDVTCKKFNTFITNGIVSHNCNYSSKIIDPIQSRCALFRFKPLLEKDVREFIQRIVKGEKLKISKSGIEAILILAEGDLRRVANLLQASASLKKNIIGDVVYEAAARAKPKDVEDMLKLVMKGNFKDARKKLHDMILIQGLSAEDIIREVHRQIYNLNISEENKIKLIDKTGEYDFRITEGGSTLIQLEALLAQFLLFGKKK